MGHLHRWVKNRRLETFFALVSIVGLMGAFLGEKSSNARPEAEGYYGTYYDGGDGYYDGYYDYYYDSYYGAEAYYDGLEKARKQRQKQTLKAQGIDVINCYWAGKDDKPISKVSAYWVQGCSEAPFIQTGNANCDLVLEKPNGQKITFSAKFEDVMCAGSRNTAKDATNCVLDGGILDEIKVSDLTHHSTPKKNVGISHSE